MGNTCSHCCGKLQDWCRDSCGCCPCECWKTTNVELTVETVDDKIIIKKDIPYGYVRIYPGEIKRELTEQVHARLRTPSPQVPLSCCEKVCQWCSETFCYCCNDSNNQVHIDPGRTINQIVGEKGERVILITIEYIRYNNIDTASYFSALATTDAAAYYKDHLHTDTLKFYLVNNEDFQQADFDLKREQGATLCRFVTHLKVMAGQYPDEPTLQNIINKHEIKVFGDPPKESMERLVGPGRSTTNMVVRMPVYAMQN